MYSRVFRILGLACAMAIVVAPIGFAGTLGQVSPTPTTYLTGTDFVSMSWSVSGGVTAELQAVGPVSLPAPPSAASGCSPADFGGFVPGRIALIERGVCTFATKAANAEAAGAAGVLIFNDGNGAAREPAFAGTLGGPGINIPVVALSYFLGRDLHNATQLGPVTVDMFVGADLWIGLKNSDSVGLRVDLKIEEFWLGNSILSGTLENQSTGSSGFNNALLKQIVLTGSGLPNTAQPGNALSVKVSVRRTCSDGGHTSGVVRLWYNGAAIDSGKTRDAASRWDTLGNVAGDTFLRDSFGISLVPGSSRLFVDTRVDSSAPCPGRPYVEIGTWTGSL